jgi:hypothetical protein
VLGALPRPLTSFIGREAEVSAALALLGELEHHASVPSAVACHIRALADAIPTAG